MVKHCLSDASFSVQVGAGMELHEAEMEAYLVSCSLLCRPVNLQPLIGCVHSMSSEYLIASLPERGGQLIHAENETKSNK